jgi:cystathionine beta-lyase, bacterial
VTNWKTKLIHPGAQAPEGYRSLADATWRGSTTLFPSSAAVVSNWDQYEAGYTYGVHGTPTTLALATRICELENGYRTIITPGGLNAIALVNLAFVKTGDHILIPESIYGPNRKMACTLLARMGVEHTFYEPTIGSGIEQLIKPNTRFIWCESPGSITMEIQDVPAIAAAAHRHGALVAIDNTWAAGVYFDALAHGADVTLQALTKYVGGHSDILLGSVTVRDERIWKQLGETNHVLGSAASPDDCALALRGLKTMAVRLEKIEESALQIARWVAEQPEVEVVLHPALESCPGHDIWKRDFTGSTGLFSIVFKEGTTREQVHAFVDALKFFKIGYSWGGVTSLVLAYDFTGTKGRPNFGHRLVRLNIGLEETSDLIADLQQALDRAIRRG